MSTDIDFQDPSVAVATLPINWYEAAIGSELTGPTEIYFRFMAIWIGFIALCESFACLDGFSLTAQAGCREDFVPAYKVWEHYLEKNRQVGKRHKCLRNEDPKYRDAVKLLALGVHKMGRLVGDIDLVEGGKFIPGNSKINNIMRVINTIRNNVFHGYKESTNKHDNDLVKSAHLVLVKLLGPEIERLKSEWYDSNDIGDDYG